MRRLSDVATETGFNLSWLARLCREGKVPGAVKESPRVWMVPDNWRPKRRRRTFRAGR